VRIPTTPDGSLVMRLGQRFEFARRLYFDPDLRELQRNCREYEKGMVLNSPPFRTTHIGSSLLYGGAERILTVIRNTVFGLYEPVFKLACRYVREPNVVVERSEKRYAGAYEDGDPSDR
jgi:hypothetical protein